MKLSAANLQTILKDEVLPFWLEHGLDPKHKGFFTSLDNDGSVVDRDKSIWMEGRAAYTFAYAYRHVEANPLWLEAAQSSSDFLLQHASDSRGRLHFLVSESGAPLRSRRYAYSEAFAALGLGELAAITGDVELKKKAASFALAFYQHQGDLGQYPEKWHHASRPSIALAPAMIQLNLSQSLEQSSGCPLGMTLRDSAIEQIKKCVKDNAVYEMVSPDGTPIDSFDGRTLNPGHALEAAWFVMKEATSRLDDQGQPDADLAELGLSMAERSWQKGWDAEHGGILYFVSADGRPIQEYWQNQKFWWPQCEAILAALSAWRLSGDDLWLERAQMAWQWLNYFHRDSTLGECFGWLNRDGSPVTTLKGSHWKGPFHYPRMLMMASELLR
jgi:N-acylglucosamine 2-epimerase